MAKWLSTSAWLRSMCHHFSSRSEGRSLPSPLTASGFKYEVLLGRSFLSYLKLEYDGTTGEIILLFPPPSLAS